MFRTSLLSNIHCDNTWKGLKIQGVIRNRKAKKYKQYNGQKIEKGLSTSNDLQNASHKSKD